MSVTIALVTMWIIGVTAVQEGLFAIDVIRSPGDGLGELSLGQTSLGEVQHAAIVKAVLANAEIALPLAVAGVALGGLLVLASLHAMLSRRAATEFTLQVVLANVVFSVADAIFSAPLRESVLATVTQSPLIGTASIHSSVVPEGWLLGASAAIEPLALAFCALAIWRWRRRGLLSAQATSADEELPG